MECYDDMTYSRYLDNDLNPDLGKEIERHLNGCERCQRLVEQLKRENRWIKKIFQVGSKIPNITPTLMRKIHEGESGEKRSKIRFLSPNRILATVAAVCLMVLLFLLFFINNRSSQQEMEREVLIQTARVEGKPVMTHVFNARDMDLKFIWLEKI